MKYFLHICCVLVLLVSPAAAQDRGQEWHDYGLYCSYTSEQLDAIETANDIFHEHTDKEILEQYFLGTNWYDLAEQTTKEIHMMIERVLDICRDGQDEFYTGSEPMDMYGLKYQLEVYNKILGALKMFAKTTTQQDDLVNKGMIILQEHLLGTALEQRVDNLFVKKKSAMSMEVSFQNNDGTYDAELDVRSEGIGDALGTIAEGNIILDTQINIDESEQDIELVGSASMDIRLVDGKLYVSLIDSTLDLEEDGFSENERNQWEKFLASLQLVKGKWVDLTSEDIGYDALLGADESMLGGITQLMGMIAKEPMLMTYSTDGDISYGGINPNMCLALGNYGGIISCLDSMWLPNFNETNGKGFVRMTQNGGEYSLSITDKYISDVFPAELVYMRDMSLLRWNNSEISYVHMPFGEYGSIVYDQGKIVGNMSIPHTSYDYQKETYREDTINVEVSGEYISQNLDMYVTIEGQDFSGVFDMKKRGSWNDLVIETDLSMNDTSSNGFSLGMSMSIDADQVETDQKNIVAPDKDTIIDLGVFID